MLIDWTEMPAEADRDNIQCAGPYASTLQALGLLDEHATLLVTVELSFCLLHGYDGEKTSHRCLNAPVGHFTSAPPPQAL